LKTVELLTPEDSEVVNHYVVDLAGKSHKWSYDDPVSLAIAVELMGRDPCLRRASDQISKDFEDTLMDGLEPEDWD
jgi:hypothetical protein